MIIIDSGWISDMPTNRAQSAFVCMVDQHSPIWAKPLTVYTTHVWLHETGHARFGYNNGRQYEFENGGSSVWAYLFRNPFTPASVEITGKSGEQFVGAGFNSTMRYAERCAGRISFWSSAYARLDSVLYFNKSDTSDRKWLANHYGWSEGQLAGLGLAAWGTSLIKGFPQSYVYFNEHCPSVRTQWTSWLAIEQPIGKGTPEATLSYKGKDWSASVTLSTHGLGVELGYKGVAGVRVVGRGTLEGKRTTLGAGSAGELWVSLPISK
jgi:hypothetical protein